MEIINKCNLNIVASVDRVNGYDLSYREFADRYLKRNRPVVLTGIMDHWTACKDWVTDDGRPNLQFISAHFGNSIVQVADCNDRVFTDQKRLEMSVFDFIAQWNVESTQSTCDTTVQKQQKQQSPLLYLKDWHFVKEYPDYVAYTTPNFFADDWLNLYLDSYSMHGNQDIHSDKNEVVCSDYRFVYMGPKGTWTPLHADVFSSYSWSANVCGKKLWYFSPPSQTHLLFDRYSKRSVYDIFGEVSAKQFPGFKETVWWECTQEINEIIFVPSGWYHQVLNLEDTISINHNWFNGHNLPWVWNLHVKDYNEAKDYIEDIREISDDFEGLCQRNLAANTGMNFVDFFMFITRFCLANIIQIIHHQKHKDDALPYTFMKMDLLVYNILSIHHVASKMKSTESFCIENLNGQHTTVDASISTLSKILEETQFVGLQMSVHDTYEILGEIKKKESPKKKSICKKCIPLLLEYSISTVGNFDSEKGIFDPGQLISLIDCIIENLDSSCVSPGLLDCFVWEDGIVR